MSLGGRIGSLAQIVALCGGLVGFGSDCTGGIQCSAYNAGVFTLKPTYNRISAPVLDSIYDLLPNVSAPVTSNPNDLIHVYESLCDQELQRLDPLIVPLKYDRNMFSRMNLLSRLKIGYFFDDHIMRCSPSVRRAVQMAVNALQSQGHELVPFRVPDSKRGLILLTKLYNYEKANKPCMQPNLSTIETKLWPIGLQLAFMKMPKVLWTGLTMIASKLFDDQFITRMSTAFAGSSFWKYTRKASDDLEELRRELQEYAQDFSCAWREAGDIEVLICPVHACPPTAMRSLHIVWPGSFYSSLFSLLDYPAAVYPNITQVDRQDFIPNVLHYAHYSRFQWRREVRDRQFMLLSVLGLDEMNRTLVDGLISDAPVGVQIVGQRFQEEKVLATLKVLERGLANIGHVRSEVE